MLKIMFRKTCYICLIFITFVIFLALYDIKQDASLEEIDKDSKVLQSEPDETNLSYLEELSDSDFSSEDDFEAEDFRKDENRKKKRTEDYQSFKFDDDDDDDDDNDDKDGDEKEEKENENAGGKRRNKPNSSQQREEAKQNVENSDENNNTGDGNDDGKDGTEDEEENDDDDRKNDGKVQQNDPEYSNYDDRSTESGHQTIVKTPFYGRFDYIKKSYEKTGSHAIRPAKPKPGLQKPEGEKFMERRFPQAVIIGFPKCGTRALLDFIAFHPYVVKSNPEVHFYDKNFFKGYRWYLEQMPYSWSNQVTMEKTPAYVRTPRARTEMKRKFPNIKLIVLVRDPVRRVVSQEAQMAAKGIRYFPDTPLSEAFMDPRGRAIDPTKYAVRQSRYYDVLLPWFRDFPREQILVINGDEFIKAPLGVMKHVEEFLKLPKYFTEDNLFFVEDIGFFCIKDFEPRPQLHCLGTGKGVKHKQLLKKHETMLYNYFKTYNGMLFRLINQRFDWDQPSN